MQDKYFVFDGVDSRDFGIWIKERVTISGAEPAVETISVPGRNGDLHFMEGSFGNRTAKVQCFVRGQNVDVALQQIGYWLLMQGGYRRLEFSWEPNTYMMARVALGPATEIEPRRVGLFSIVFDCMPQKFYKSGEQPITVTSKTGHIIRNPGMESKPLLICHGTGGYGSVSIRYGGQNSTSVSFVDINGTIALDCETMNAYSGTENKNSAVSLQHEGFPTLMPGDNSVSVFGAVTKVEVVPRWWVL